MTYATFDPANKSAGVTLSGSDLIATGSTAGAWHGAVCTSYKTSGKWYAEFTGGGSNGGTAYGISDGTLTPDGYSLGDGADDSYGYLAANGYKYHSGALVAYGASFTPGTVISVLYDADAGTLSFWKNGSDQGVAYTGITGAYALAATVYDLTCTATLNAGQSAFAYTPPAGYDAWGDIPPTPGNGVGTLSELAGVGYRIAAGAGTMEQFTAAGGYNGLGAGTLEFLVVSGAGGPKAGAGTMESFTASGTGHQAARGDATLESLTATGTGYDSEIWTFAGSASVPTLSASILTGEVITFANEAPAPTLEIGTKDAVLTAPAPTLTATLLPGVVITSTLRAPAPVLVSVNFNPAIITVEGLARAPILVATLTAGQILTFSGSARSPVLTAAGVSGSVSTMLLTAPAPIMVAAGFPAYTITVAVSAPPPWLSSSLSGAVAATWNTWALNTRKGALTKYDNFNFDSFAAFNGQVIAVNSSGIVVLGTQDLDNATTISSTIKSGKDKFASSVIKRIPRIYINYSTDGDAQFKLITTEGGSRTYALNWNHGTGIQTRRIPVGKGPKSVTWQWEYTNIAGADFDLDAVLAYPIKLRRRVP